MELTFAVQSEISQANIRWIAMKASTDYHVPLWKHLYDIGNPLTFPFTPQAR